MTRVAVGLSAEYTGSDLKTQDVSTTVPLPVISFNLIYNISPKFDWGLRAEAFALKFDEWDGVYTDISLKMEYRAFKNVGLGIALNSNSLKIIQETSDHKFILENRISGVLISVAAYF